MAHVVNDTDTGVVREYRDREVVDRDRGMSGFGWAILAAIVILGLILLFGFGRGARNTGTGTTNNPSINTNGTSGGTSGTSY